MMSGGRFKVKRRLNVHIRGGVGFSKDLRRVIYPSKLTKSSQSTHTCIPSASAERFADDGPSTESSKYCYPFLWCRCSKLSCKLGILMPLEWNTGHLVFCPLCLFWQKTCNV